MYFEDDTPSDADLQQEGEVEEEVVEDEEELEEDLNETTVFDIDIPTIEPGKTPPLPDRVDLYSIVSKQCRMGTRDIYTPKFKKIFLHHTCQQLISEVFWYMLLLHFRRVENTRTHNIEYNKEVLFDTMAAHYTTLFLSTAKGDEKDTILQHLPDVVAQTVFTIFFTLFEPLRDMFNEQFRKLVLQDITWWFTGMVLQQAEVSHWHKQRRKKRLLQEQREKEVLQKKIDTFFGRPTKSHTGTSSRSYMTTPHGRLYNKTNNQWNMPRGRRKSVGHVSHLVGSKIVRKGEQKASQNSQDMYSIKYDLHSLTTENYRRRRRMQLKQALAQQQHGSGIEYPPHTTDAASSDSSSEHSPPSPTSPEELSYQGTIRGMNRSKPSSSMISMYPNDDDTKHLDTSKDGYPVHLLDTSWNLEPAFSKLDIPQNSKGTIHNTAKESKLPDQSVVVHRCHFGLASVSPLVQRYLTLTAPFNDKLVSNNNREELNMSLRHADHFDETIEDLLTKDGGLNRTKMKDEVAPFSTLKKSEETSDGVHKSSYHAAAAAHRIQQRLLDAQKELVQRPLQRPPSLAKGYSMVSLPPTLYKDNAISPTLGLKVKTLARQVKARHRGGDGGNRGSFGQSSKGSATKGTLSRTNLTQASFASIRRAAPMVESDSEGSSDTSCNINNTISFLSLGVGSIPNKSSFFIPDSKISSPTPTATTATTATTVQTNKRARRLLSTLGHDTHSLRSFASPNGSSSTTTKCNDAVLHNNKPNDNRQQPPSHVNILQQYQKHTPSTAAAASHTPPAAAAAAAHSTTNAGCNTFITSIPQHQQSASTDNNVRSSDDWGHESTIDVSPIPKDRGTTRHHKSFTPPTAHPHSNNNSSIHSEVLSSLFADLDVVVEKNKGTQQSSHYPTTTTAITSSNLSISSEVSPNNNATTRKRPQSATVSVNRPLSAASSIKTPSSTQKVGSNNHKGVQRPASAASAPIASNGTALPIHRKRVVDMFEHLQTGRTPKTASLSGTRKDFNDYRREFRHLNNSACVKTGNKHQVINWSNNLEETTVDYPAEAQRVLHHKKQLLQTDELELQELHILRSGRLAEYQKSQILLMGEQQKKLALEKEKMSDEREQILCTMLQKIEHIKRQIATDAELSVIQIHRETLDFIDEHMHIIPARFRALVWEFSNKYKTKLRQLIRQYTVNNRTAIEGNKEIAQILELQEDIQEKANKHNLTNPIYEDWWNIPSLRNPLLRAAQREKENKEDIVNDITKVTSMKEINDKKKAVYRKAGGDVGVDPEEQRWKSQLHEERKYLLELVSKKREKEYSLSNHRVTTAKTREQLAGELDEYDDTHVEPPQCTTDQEIADLLDAAVDDNVFMLFTMNFDTQLLSSIEAEISEVLHTVQAQQQAEADQALREAQRRSRATPFTHYTYADIVRLREQQMQAKRDQEETDQQERDEATGLLNMLEDSISTDHTPTVSAIEQTHHGTLHPSHSHMSYDTSFYDEESTTDTRTLGEPFSPTSNITVQSSPVGGGGEGSSVELSPAKSEATMELSPEQGEHAKRHIEKMAKKMNITGVNFGESTAWSRSFKNLGHTSDEMLMQLKKRKKEKSERSFQGGYYSSLTTHDTTRSH